MVLSVAKAEMVMKHALADDGTGEEAEVPRRLDAESGMLIAGKGGFCKASEIAFLHFLRHVEIAFLFKKQLESFHNFPL